MRSRAALILGLLLVAFAADAAWAEKRVALVIGNSAYQNVPRLANPANDAAAVADMLRRAQFEVVESKRDLGNADMRRAFREFNERSRDAEMAVIYYAGHGIEVDGQNYLIPTDALLVRDSDAYDEAITLDRVLQVIEPAKKLRLVILDACRDNPFSRTMKRTLASRALERGLIGVEPGKPNTLIAFAAKAGSTAADGAGSHSPFTTALLQHLTIPDLDLRQAFGRVRDDVMKATGNKQEPFVYGSLGGATVSLVATPARAPTIVSQPAASPAAEVRRDYELALQVGNRKAWEIFLQQYATGFYSNLAQVQLDKIAAEEARVAATERSRQAEAEKARLAAEKASAAAQEQAARDARAAEDARIAAEKQRQAEQTKADSAERARIAAELAAAERLVREKAEAEANAIRAKAQTEAKAIRDRAEIDARAAADARKAAESEAERLRLAALDQARPVPTPAASPQAASSDKPAQVAALPADGRTALAPPDLSRTLQSELRRVGCQTGQATDEWGAAARRSLELFNKHAGTRLDAKLASLDALDAVKGKQARICPLVCDHGFRATGEKCEKIVCRAGYAVGGNNACEKVAPRTPATKAPAKEAPVASTRKQDVAAPKAAAGSNVFCDNSGCRPVPRGCRVGHRGGNMYDRMQGQVICD